MEAFTTTLLLLACSPPYTQVGDRCLFIDNVLSGNWTELTAVCQDLGGELVDLHDANLLAYIVEHLYETGRSDVSYWVGATDQAVEGQWNWLTGAPVHMNTPLWGDLKDGVQQPTGGAKENCAVLLKEDYYFMHDASCSNPHSLICQQTPDSLLQDPALSTTRGRPSVECPHPYEVIGGRCLFVNVPSSGTWEEQRRFCELLHGGHMIKLDDANVLGALFDYLHAHDLTSSYVYIGGSDSKKEGDWRWLDGTPVRMGTPFWGAQGSSPQEPQGGTSQNCSSLINTDHFFLHDLECDSLVGVICEH
ncbi:macrophage mannose receptor 1-like isoform X1 [Homarus americanus]|uniref:Macrophage mannose receptor 1-like 6 n=1 Tax=Homarus americanus TaxID=6706 RepID=A0A8J5TL54_HOMAM|nr:macrophage mannose receptor 1-like isoform X1 [Homarus americanus]KAG7177914.1 macrophage mannose receptor 1-like 6 [Homarus americanus]